MTNEGKPIDNDYLRCTAYRSFYKNAYTIKHPADSSITVHKVNGGYQKRVVGPDTWYIDHQRALYNHLRVEDQHQWVFFAEEPLVMNVTPPFMHQTKDKSSGFISSGAYDIGKWFRPIARSYMLFPGQDTLTVAKDDPAFYVNFLTDKKVILKPFELAEELHRMTYQLLEHKNRFPNEPLEKTYERFMRSHRNKRVLKIIKENLL
jgi:hypothetical protein